MNSHKIFLLNTSSHINSYSDIEQQESVLKAKDQLLICCKLAELHEQWIHLRFTRVHRILFMWYAERCKQLNTFNIVFLNRVYLAVLSITISNSVFITFTRKIEQYLNLWKVLELSEDEKYDLVFPTSGQMKT